MKQQHDTINISELKGVNYLCEDDLYDLAKCVDKILNVKNPVTHLSRITIHGLAGKYKSLNWDINSEDVEAFLIKKGFFPNQEIINNEKF